MNYLRSITNALNSAIKPQARIYVYILVVLLPAIFALAVWPTMYRYDHLNIRGEVHPVRIHRFSGNAEILYKDGWQTAARDASATLANEKPKPIPVSELAKLDTTAKLLYNRTLDCTVYNGSSYNIYELLVNIQVTSGTKKVIDRDYRLRCDGYAKPLAAKAFYESLGFELANGQTWTWHIKEAFGKRE